MAATDTMHGDTVAENSEQPSQSEPSPAAPPTQTFATELLKAMQVAAAQNRDVMVERFRAESSAFLEKVKTRSTDEANELRRSAEEDLGAIRDWSKAEIARIKAETDERVGERRSGLERQLEQHAALVERQVEKLTSRIAEFEDEVGRFFSSLEAETDAAVFAGAAQRMPEAPDLVATDAAARAEALRELGTRDQAATEDFEPVAMPSGEATGFDAGVSTASKEPEAPTAPDQEATTTTASDESPVYTSDAGVWTSEPAPATEAPVQTDQPAAGAPDMASTSADSQGWESTLADTDRGEPSAWQPVPEAVADTTWQPEPSAPADSTWAPADQPMSEPSSEPAAASDQPATDAGLSEAASTGGEGWETTALDPRLVSLGLLPGNGHIADAPVEGETWQPAPTSPDEGWSAGTSDGSAGSPYGEPATAISTEAPTTEADPASMEHDPAARLAGLVPSSEFPATRPAEPPPAELADVVPTQVVVTGLVSVASIASFKRHLARVPGVQSVGVSSGPDGEFIFKATHEANVALRDVIPALPGFGARLVSATDGALHVTARDPEADA